MNFNLDVLKIDPVQELDKLSKFIVEQVSAVFRKKGVVVGLSGGIDSACIAAVAVHAIGKEKVFGLVLPESESNPISSEYAIKHAKALGIEHRQINITPTVDSIVTYEWRDEFLQKLIPDYKPGYKYNITLPTDLLERASFSFYRLQVEMPDGEIKTKRLNQDQFRTITSFANIKIRARMYQDWVDDQQFLELLQDSRKVDIFDFCKDG